MENTVNNVEEGDGSLVLEQTGEKEKQVEADPNIISEEKDVEKPGFADLVESPVMIKKGEEYQSIRIRIQP